MKVNNLSKDRYIITNKCNGLYEGYVFFVVYDIIEKKYKGYWVDISDSALYLENRYLDIIRFLLENGINTNTNNDYTLKLAISKGHLEVIKCLIEKARCIPIMF